MSIETATIRHHRLLQIILKEDWVYLAVSLLVQLVLGLFFGHLYDIRISMATGYLVATGQDPYIAQNLTQVFHNPAFQGMTSIGYPPPWPLMLGGIYLLSFSWLHNLLFYNLAIKLPIIAANVGLAYLVKNILRSQGVSSITSRKAWLFLLFNPFLIYFTTAWGQFDSLCALLTLAALMLLHKQRIVPSALLLALAISFKPTPVPVALAVVAYLWKAPWRRLIRYLVIFTLGLLVLCVLPFFVFHWDATPIFQGWNAQFSVSGGMSPTTLYELIANTYLLPGFWWLLGFIWIPAVIICAIFLPRGDVSLTRLIWNSLILILIFFLTRTWLSEQNLTLILPLVLVLVSLGELPNLCLTTLWVLPLIFTIFNTSPAQLLFPILPNLMNMLLKWSDIYRAFRLEVRMLLVIPWQVVGWWMVFHKAPKRSPVTV